HLQQDTLIEQIAVTNQANPALVNQRAELAATPAPGHGTGLRLELDQQGVVGGWATGYGVIAWPESGKINRMHGDSRDRWMVGLATTNLPASLPVNPLFPPILRRTQKKAGLRRPNPYKGPSQQCQPHPAGHG